MVNQIKQPLNDMHTNRWAFRNTWGGRTNWKLWNMYCQDAAKTGGGVASGGWAGWQIGIDCAALTLLCLRALLCVAAGCGWGHPGIAGEELVKVVSFCLPWLSNKMSSPIINLFIFSYTLFWVGFTHLFHYLKTLLFTLWLILFTALRIISVRVIIQRVTRHFQESQSIGCFCSVFLYSSVKCKVYCCYFYVGLLLYPSSWALF